jgi:pyrroline-5-carboxylate reductase
MVSTQLAGHAKVVASVLAGVDVGRLRSAYAVPVFRIIPNTPVEVRRGVMCYSPEAEVDPRLEADVLELFGRLGTVVTVPEKLMGPAGALMGVGPAYQALLVEAQVDAGVRHGLAAPLAGRLVAETMAGTAALLETRDYDTLAIRREVTSPGGTTARGLAALERGGVRPAFQEAFDAVLGWTG